MFNSQYPFGVVPTGGYLFRGGGTTPSFQSYLVRGALNRIVLTQVCRCGARSSDCLNMKSIALECNEAMVFPF